MYFSWKTTCSFTQLQLFTLALSKSSSRRFRYLCPRRPCHTRCSGAPQALGKAHASARSETLCSLRPLPAKSSLLPEQRLFSAFHTTCERSNLFDKKAACVWTITICEGAGRRISATRESRTGRKRACMLDCLFTSKRLKEDIGLDAFTRLHFDTCPVGFCH